MLKRKRPRISERIPRTKEKTAVDYSSGTKRLQERLIKMKNEKDKDKNSCYYRLEDSLENHTTAPKITNERL